MDEEFFEEFIKMKNMILPICWICVSCGATATGDMFSKMAIVKPCKCGSTSLVKNKFGELSICMN